MSDRPAMLWFKARMPTTVRDGSSVASMNLARCLAESFDIDLVSLRLTGREDAAAAEICPPFRSVTVVDPDNSGGMLRRLAYRAAYDARSVATGVPRGVFYESCANVRRTLLKLATRRSYAVAHFEYWTSGMLLDLPLGCPKVVMLHDATFHTYEQQGQSAAAAKMKRFEQRVIALADRTHFISDWDQSLLEADGMENLRTLPVLMPALAPSAAASDAANVLFVGRFEHWPNRDGLTWLVREIVPLVRRQVKHAKFRIAGPGLSIRDRAAYARDGVELLGWVDDLAEVYADASVVAAPIRYGTGVNLKVLEAMWRGLPVVTTSLGAKATPARHGAAIVGDSAEDFAAGLVELLTDRTARARLREHAWDLLQRDHCGELAHGRARQAFEQLIVADRPVRSSEGVAALQVG